MNKHKEKESCFSCDSEFEPEESNDREEGWFCDDCLDIDKQETWVKVSGKTSK